MAATFTSLPVVPSTVPMRVEALRSVATLEGLTTPEYTWLAEHATERTFNPGDLVFAEGDPAHSMNILLRGEVHVRRQRTGPLALFVGRAGHLSGKLPFSRMKHYGGDGYAVDQLWGLDIEEEDFPAMLQAIPSMAQRCVSVLLDRVREVTRMEQQAEKLSALGKLAANLAHELNNPASAAQRSAATLAAELREYGQGVYRLGSLASGPEIAEQFFSWGDRAWGGVDDSRRANAAGSYDPVKSADQSDTLARWLGAHHVAEPWRIAPILAESGISPAQLDDLLATIPGSFAVEALAIFANYLRVDLMAATVLNATARIFDLITAIKDFSYMDQAPVQQVNLAASLTSTLAMFQSRLSGIQLETDFDPEMPAISAYGSELNQVWTALIENALDAMEGSGTLRLTARCAGKMAVVEIINYGPAIDPALQSRIFEPFFTTKAPGKGLGLGLDTAQRIVSRHSGFLTVESAGSRTCFVVQLPFGQVEAY